MNGFDWIGLKDVSEFILLFNFGGNICVQIMDKLGRMSVSFFFFVFFHYFSFIEKHYCCVQLFSSSRLSGQGESSNAAFGSSKSFGDQSQQTSFMPLAIEKGQSETA